MRTAALEYFEEAEDSVQGVCVQLPGVCGR